MRYHYQIPRSARNDNTKNAECSEASTYLIMRFLALLGMTIQKMLSAAKHQLLPHYQIPRSARNEQCHAERNEACVTTLQIPRFARNDNTKNDNTKNAECRVKPGITTR